MAYAVELTHRAIRDLHDLYEYTHATDSRAAQQWFNGLEVAIHSLELFPRRCPRAPESRRRPPFLRYLLYGDKPNIYRVLYKVDERRKIVHVVSVRHGARYALKASERAKP